ncbi:chromodomain-containing protein [Fusarium mundagurra]|uniref:Chromodomain-containing protein n=1 Tax=Fusarium mundagurra TaxID=1567541 RepID=A0A8H5XFN7_9HYPO|nr:chromodomain-containing protein [Fusarium mundagurra]KAF5700484.1 chromodomain-containing protein [Fusarium mundagurra]
MAIERPSLSFPGQRIRAGMEDSWILKNAKATKTDDKTSLNSSGTDWDSFMKYSVVNFNWYDYIRADKHGEIKAERERKQHDAYMANVAAEGAPRRPAVKSQNRERKLKYRLRKAREEQLDVEYYTQDSIRKPELSPRISPEGGHETYIAKVASEDAPRRVSLDSYSASTPGLRPTRPLEFGHGYPSPGPYGSIPPHRSTDELLNCRLRSTHYTISQDHTSGKEAHKDNLLASFGKRRRTDKPSISLDGSRLFDRSTNMLANLSNGNDVVAQNEGSGVEESSISGVDVFDFLAPLGSQIPEDAVSFPREVATTKPNEGKDRGDKIEIEWSQGHIRRGKSLTHPPRKTTYASAVLAAWGNSGR